MSAVDRSPLISTVIPCHNGGRYLGEAVESILGQRYPAIEIIVIDDGSTDDSREVATGFGSAIRYRHQPQSGAAAARNRGIEMADGEFLAFLDADDLWTAGKLAKQMAAFEADPSLEIVAGHAEQFVSPELPEEARVRVRVDPGKLPAQLPGALLVRRHAFDRVGAYAARFVTASELDWFARATDLGVRILTLPDVVLRRRIHTTNHGLLRRDARQDYVRMVKAALDRRRDASRATGV